MDEFEVQLKYEDKSDYGKHKLVEIWNCSGLENLKRLLCDVLDLIKDNDGIPREPERDQIKDSLFDYSLEEDFIEEELKRQTRSYSTYQTLIKEASRTDISIEDAIYTDCVSVDIGDECSISLQKKTNIV